MSYAFTKGDSQKTTVTTRNHGVKFSHKANTMKGLPGLIKTGQDASKAGLVQNTGIGPRREGQIGKRGAAGAKSHFTAATSRGSADKSYKATSTGPAGRVSGGKMEGLKGRVKFSSER